MTLNEALHVILSEEHLGDFVYTVRDRAAESGDGYDGDRWKHPRVQRFSAALNVLQQMSKSCPWPMPGSER